MLELNPRTLSALFFLAAFSPSVAADQLDSAGTAWLLTSACVVLFMTVPGLGLFYGGLVRSKNVLAVMMACFAIAAVVSFIWICAGYSLAFTDGGVWQGALGGAGRFFLNGIDAGAMVSHRPEALFAMFHMAVAIFASSLIVGALAERVKFSAVLLFCSLWALLVYVPVCHWIWGEGWLARLGVIDFAGGIVVHGSAGIAGLVCAVLAGPRRGFPNSPLMPHNLPLTATGTGILAVGWFVFSAGCAVTVNRTAVSAMLATVMCASAAAMTWLILDWLRFGKPSVLGVMTGMVAGLGTIASAAGLASPQAALAVGVVAGVVSFYAIRLIKQRLRIDDALDVFPVHGASGVAGALLVSIFIDAEGHSAGGQLLAQFFGVLAAVVWSGAVSYILFKLIDGALGVRVPDDQEIVGLDISLHNERGYDR